MPNKEPTYDISELIAISRGNESFVKKMVDIFCDQTPVLLKNMLEAYDAGDLQKMGEIAHKLKPSIDNLKITSVTQKIREIEKRGTGDLGNSNLKEILYETEAVLTNVVSLLKKDYPANNAVQ
jgi:HPt (histidine-containing phosphotransfer) domain-containing protein